MPDEIYDKLVLEIYKLSRYFALESWQVLNVLGLNNPSQLRGRYNDIAISWDVIDRNVVNYAVARAGELIAGDIMVTTVDRIAEKVVQAIQKGSSIGELKESIMEAGILSESRAEMIARTETAIAAIEGRQETMLEILPDGLKEWLLADDACDECSIYSGVTVPISEEFEEGDPPLHPNCRCDLLYWTSEEVEQRQNEPDTEILDLGLE